MQFSVGLGFSLSSCVHKCDFVQKPRSERLLRSNSAQARVPVPLKGVGRAHGERSRRYEVLTQHLDCYA